MNTINNIPLGCNLDALNPEQRERHDQLAQTLFASVESRQELADGYAFRLPSEASMCLTVAEFVTLERLCCPFLNFALEVEADGGPLWFKLTGPGEVKQVLQAELGLGEVDAEVVLT